ncbi:MAG: nitroreductase family protein [Candidatus Gracilibacteria bacterium]|nr:nitroreductase family protein [bacterium]MDZ4216977.1 nitroreductase family protein [Candidatus Gracilibacteria bacterium]
MNSYPQKSAPSVHPIHDLISKRWSPLAFSSEPIEPEKIKSLFEAMRWAPSSYNGQPWRVIYATQDKPEQFEKIASLLNEGNAWAKQAYLLMVICSVKDFEYNGKPNKHHQYDTGAGIENLFLQAVSMGLVGHEMEGYDEEKSYELLNIPKDKVKSMAMMAVGYPGEESALSEDRKKRQEGKRERKPIEEIAFEGEWKS